jgi:selenophosphate synthase
LQEVKKSTIKINPAWFDSFYNIEGKKPELTRRVFSLTEPAVDRELEVKRAMTILRIHTGIGESSQLLSEALEKFLKAFAAKVSASCTSAVLTEHPDAQFAMFDYIELHRGDKAGYMPAITAVTHVTDVTRDPDADIHTSIAMTSAIERLNLLGCGLSSSFKLFPVYDAPSEVMLDRIRSNLDAYTSRYNLAMEDYSSLKINKLFYGTSAMATTTQELPTKYELVEEGMEIIVTNRFGGLPALSLYTLGRMDSENIIKYESSDLSFESISKAREEVIKNLSEPHFALGKIVAKYLPQFGTPFDKNTHITAVYPVGSGGIFSLGALAESTNAHLVVNSVPLKYEEMSKFATKEYLVENATASLNGCHLMVASTAVIELVMEELRKHNFSPERIGTVSKKGQAAVTFAAGVNAGEYVAAKPKLQRLTSAPVQQPAS